MIVDNLISRLHDASVTSQLLGEDMLYGAILAGAEHTLLLYFHGSEQELSTLTGLLGALSAYLNAAPPAASAALKWVIDMAQTSDDDARLAEIIAQHPTLLQADACIYADSSLFEDDEPALALGVKGLLRVELALQTTTELLPIEHGGVVPNALWRLIWALSSLKDAREEILIDGFYDPVLPAGEDEITLLQTLSNTRWVERWHVQETLSGLQGLQFHYAHLLIPGCTVTAIGSDGADTRVPGHASARVDFHLVPEQDPHACFGQLHQHLQEHGFQDVQLRLLAASQPVRTALHQPFVQLVLQASRTAYGQTPLLLPLTAASRSLAPIKRHFDIPLVIARMDYDHMQCFQQIVAVLERMR